MKKLSVRSFCCRYSCFPVSRPPGLGPRCGLDHRYCLLEYSWKTQQQPGLFRKSTGSNICHQTIVNFSKPSHSTKKNREINVGVIVWFLTAAISYEYYNSTSHNSFMWAFSGKFGRIINHFSRDHPLTARLCWFKHVSQMPWFVCASCVTLSLFFSFINLLMINWSEFQPDVVIVQPEEV